LFPKFGEPVTPVKNADQALFPLFPETMEAISHDRFRPLGWKRYDPIREAGSGGNNQLKPQRTMSGIGR
jgi:hypothetical protein